MSYCGGINFTKGFGTEPGALILSRYLAANCLTPPPPPPRMNCTHISQTYNNEVVPDNTEVIAETNITIQSNVSIANGATVNWQAEIQFVVNGEFTVPYFSNMTVVAEECE